MNLMKLRLPVLLLCAAAMVSCGGGGGQLAGGGIGGSGIGTVTGFASVIINKTREFVFDPDTRFFRDGTEVSETDFMQDGLGMVTRVDVGSDVSSTFSSGTAVTVSAENAVKGPVTATSPLQVLDQPLTITGNTLLVDVPGNDTANLVVGDIVEVSGYADAMNGIQVTRLQLKAGGLLEWKLTGPVNTVIANTSFRIGSQLVMLNGVVPVDCGSGLQDGDHVEVRAASDPGFTAGNALATVTSVECKMQGLGMPANASGPLLEGEIEGIVTIVNAPGDFIVNGQRVLTTAATEFAGGTAEDIIPGARLEAEGTLDTTNGNLTADEINFDSQTVRIETPVAPADVDTGTGVITVMNFSVNTSPMTEDPDNVLGGGLTATTQLSIRGFVDQLGQVFATEIKDIGTPDLADVRLRGPAGMIANPTFGILGVTVDTATATSIIDETVEPNEVLNATQFFNRITNGTPVEVKAGDYDSILNRITTGDIMIED